VEADVATAQSDAANVASARLSMQGTLAQDYVALRAADDEIRLLENAVEAYRRTVSITKNKYAVGVAARSDIITAQTQLDSTRAQLIGVGVQRAQFEHAIAVLLGKAPADFSIARRPAMGITMPQVPAQMPSSLLERRPDVASAERLAAAANAKVGIQTAAYYPTFSISGAAGYEGSPLNQLITTPFKFWTLGAQATDTLLDWGQRHDVVLSARAAYEAAAANYRQTVLTALQQVEDNLAGLRILNSEAGVEQDAVNEAVQAAQIALNEYNAGTVDFTTVVAAQVTELTNRETALGIVSSQLTSSVALIQALGGGWTSAELPSPAKVVAH
jgi:NodT family efflux transporter outer membrane factor (OMF) lipoprotein